MKTSKTANLLTGTLSICLALALSAETLALTPIEEADRLLSAAEQAFADDNRQQADEYLSDALLLGIALPPEFNFLYGKLLVQQNNGTEARRYLEQYIGDDSTDNRYYREALSLIAQIEKQNQTTTSSQATASPLTRSQAVGPQSNNPRQSGKRNAVISRVDSDGLPYVDHIQQLYKAETTASALTQHLNNLLKFYAFGDERVVASTRSGKPSRHKIQFSSEGEIISFNKVGAANAPYTEDRFSVYGVNPHISFQCRAATSSCWLYHPITSQRWLQIVRNEDVALEISKALSQLIRDLQKNT
jgi:hypothetical protein